MADPFAWIRVMGTEVACYLRPGTECDVAALTHDVHEACKACGSIEEVRAGMRSVAEAHALDVEPPGLADLAGLADLPEGRPEAGPLAPAGLAL